MSCCSSTISTAFKLGHVGQACLWRTGRGNAKMGCRGQRIDVAEANYTEPFKMRLVQLYVGVF